MIGQCNVVPLMYAQVPMYSCSSTPPAQVERRSSDVPTLLQVPLLYNAYHIIYVYYTCIYAALQLFYFNNSSEASFHFKPGGSGQDRPLLLDQ